MKSFKDLKVWQRSIEFVTEIYQATEKFPRGEIYGLTSQIRRAAVAIPSNIAEGHTRNNIKEYIQFLYPEGTRFCEAGSYPEGTRFCEAGSYIVRSSAAEVETQLQIAFNLKFLETPICQNLTTNLEEIQMMLSGLISKLRSIKSKSNT